LNTQAHADGSFTLEGVIPSRYVVQASGQALDGTVTVDIGAMESSPVQVVMRGAGRSTITVDAPIELFDGLTMLRYIEGGALIDEFALKADVPGQSRRTLPAEAGAFRIQAWRRSSLTDTSGPKSFLLDESFELKADETRTLTILAPR
jgi:hypothetical protein